MINSSPPLTLFTIGHSTLPIAQFADLLLAHSIRLVVDVRTVPRSRHNPQYNGDALPLALQQYGISYEHMPGLGGLRHAKKDSVNTGWENASFRGFADYMQTPEFAESLRQLVERARTVPTAIMCAEAVPWRCHRSLIGDALLVRGVLVKDIIGKGTARDHAMTPWANVERERITYPESEQTRERKQRT